MAPVRQQPGIDSPVRVQFHGDNHEEATRPDLHRSGRCRRACRLRFRKFGRDPRPAGATPEHRSRESRVVLAARRAERAAYTWIACEETMVHLAISRADVELSPGSEVILRPHTWADYEELLECRGDNAAVKVHCLPRAVMAHSPSRVNP